MAARDPHVRSLSGSIAAVERHHGPDDPRLPELRQQLVEAHILASIAAAPPLSAETLEHLRRLLPPAPVNNPGQVAELTDAPADARPSTLDTGRGGGDGP